MHWPDGISKEQSALAPERKRALVGGWPSQTVTMPTRELDKADRSAMDGRRHVQIVARRCTRELDEDQSVGGGLLVRTSLIRSSQ